MCHMPQFFDDDIISIRKCVGITITSALRQCKLPAYVHMRSGKSSRDVFCRVRTLLDRSIDVCSFWSSVSMFFVPCW